MAEFFTAIFSPLAKVFGFALAFIYAGIPNLGVAIAILTVVVMVALFPLTMKQTKSMLEMQRFQPQIKALQAKYKGDKQKLNEEMMKFYQENKVNPLAGCWPLLVQMPLLGSLFALMREPQKYLPANSKLFAALCQGASASDCQKAITENGFPKSLDFLGMNLHFSPMKAFEMPGSWIQTAPYFILVTVLIVLQFFQSVQSQRGMSDISTQQQLIARVLPVGFGLISLFFPAGTTVYSVVSAVVRVGQQEIILRKITLPHRERMAARKAEDEALEAPEDDGYQSRRAQKRKKK